MADTTIANLNYIKYVHNKELFYLYIKNLSLTYHHIFLMIKFKNDNKTEENKSFKVASPII